MTWQTCLRFVTRRRVPVLATTPDRAETSTWVRPMHDLTRLEVLQRLLCNFRTGTRLRLGNFAPRESTVAFPSVVRSAEGSSFLVALEIGRAHV